MSAHNRMAWFAGTMLWAIAMPAAATQVRGRSITTTRLRHSRWSTRPSSCAAPRTPA